MKIFNLSFHRKDQIDILPDVKPMICLHREGINEKGERFSRRVFVIYFLL